MPKFIDLLTSRSLWLTNAEVLAREDPYEGLPGAVQFPHRIWKTLDEVPEQLRRQILEDCDRDPACTPEAAFQGWVMVEEQRCIMAHTGRRDYYVNCWHAADHESAAMWKIYASPGAGIAIVTNGGRIETALSANEQSLYLGAVRYRDSSLFEVGGSNSFDPLMIKRKSYAYEQEVRLVYWNTDDIHNSLANFSWNKETLRFENLVEDTRPLRMGISLVCDVDTLIDRVIISPFAPQWYGQVVTRLREQLGFRFPVYTSRMLNPPTVIA